MNIHKHSNRSEGSWRGYTYLGEKCEWQGRMEVSRRWRNGLIMTCGYGGQEDFFEWTFALPRLFFLHVAIDTPWHWKKLRPFDGKYSESERKFGLYSVAGTLYLLVGYDSMGTHYSTHGRGGFLGRWLRDIKRNQQVTLFRGDWILGKAKHSMEILEQDIPIEVNVGQWDGDSYPGKAQHERRTWKRRFSTKVWDGYQIDMEKGIPFPGKGENSWDCGDDAYYGFGADTIEGAISRIVEDVKKRRGKNWRPSEVSS